MRFVPNRGDPDKMLLCAPSCVTILSLFSSALWGRVRLWSASVPSVLLLLPVHERSAKLQPTADAPMIRKRLNHAGERLSRSHSCVADARPIVARSTSGVCEFEILVRFYNQGITNNSACDELRNV